MMNMTEMVKHLLIINIIFFAGSFLIPNSSELFALYYFESDKFRLWQPITHMFMHGGLMHIFFNMFALVSFGSTLEQFWGGKKFVFFYISCGIGAMLLHTGVNYYLFHQGLDILVENGINQADIIQALNEGKYNTQWLEIISQSTLDNMLSAYLVPVVGASGAVYGLLVAFAFMFPNAELALMFIPVPIKAKYFVPVILSIDLFLGLKGESLFGSGGTGVAHFAHLGGALCGFLMMWYWKKNQFNNNRWN